MRYIQTCIAVLFLLMTLFMQLTFAQSDDLRDWIGNLEEEAEQPFGYIGDKELRVKEITKDKIVFESDVVNGTLDEEIKSYTLLYGNSSLGDILEKPELLSDTTEKNYTFNEFDSGTFTMELSVKDDDLDAKQTYYVLARPFDDLNNPGELSNEICFTLDTESYGKGSECSDADSSSSASHGSAPDMSLANITHTINDDKVTLKWTAVNGADKIDVFLWYEDDEIFKKLKTVNMSDESYTYTAEFGGPHTVKFIPMDDGQPTGKEVTYTLNVDLPEAEKPAPKPESKPQPKPEEGIKDVPQVGPKEDLAMVFLITIGVYLLYRVAFRKRH